MTSLLIVEEILEFSELYELNLYAYVGIEDIKRVSTPEAAIEEFSKKHYDLVITKAVVDSVDLVLPLIEQIEEKKTKTHLIILGESVEKREFVHSLPAGIQFGELVKLVAKILGVTAKTMVNKVVPDYFPFTIDYFLRISNTVCEVFDEDLDHKGTYVRKFEVEDPTYSRESISIWMKQGAKVLYTAKNDRLHFVNHVSRSIIASMDLENSKLTQDEHLVAGEMSMKYMSELISKVGVTEETQLLARKNIKSVAKIAKNERSLEGLVNRLLKNKNGYLFRHIQLLTFLSMHIMKNLDWGSTEQEEKMAFIAFFHDICLSTDEQAMIHSKEELKAAGFDSVEKDLVEKHAMNAAGVVGALAKMPMGVDTIIRQHHGMMNGVGFSESFSANLSPLAIVFIIAEEFARILFQFEGHAINFKQVNEILKKKFPTKRFEKILDAMESIPL